MIDYRAPTTADAAALSRMAADSFAVTFSGKLSPAAMQAYLEQAYGPAGQMTQDLADPAIRWQAAFRNGVPVGYVKLSAMTLPHAADPRALELRQLYVAEAVKGAGVADRLMDWAIATAREASAPELFLAVFDDNARAVRFYARHGFEKIGTFDFRTGDEVHDDGVWRREL